MTRFKASDRRLISEHLAGDPRPHRVSGTNRAQTLHFRDIIACPSAKAAMSILPALFAEFDPRSDLDVKPLGKRHRR